MSFEGLIRKAQNAIVNNAPAILTGLGVAGVVSTVVLAVRATIPAIRDIHDAESERTEPLTLVEKGKLTWRYYLGTVVVGGVTITCILGASTIHSRRQAAIMSVYALTETAFREYREKTTEVIGSKKSSEIQDEIAKEHLTGVPMVNSEVIITGTGDHLIFDSMSSRYFRSSIEKVRAAVNEINAECLRNMYASQNDFYRKIGLPPAVFGEELGWSFENLMDVHFSTVLTEDGEPALSLEYLIQPIHGYHKVNR